MEIKFSKLSYTDKNKNTKLLDNISLDIKSGSIVSFLGENLDIIPNLLNIIKRPSSGEIKIDKTVIRRTSHITNISNIRKKLGLVFDDNEYYEETIKDEIKSTMKNNGCKITSVIKHIVDSLKLVGLDDSYLDRRIDSLSTSEKKKFNLALVLSYNPDVIILNNFFQGMYYRDKEYFKKLFKKLKSKFKKTIIVLTRDLKDTIDLVDKIYVINNGVLVLNGGQELYYSTKLYKYCEMPKIVEFTKYAQEQGHNILEYTDLKELIKELYRKVS